MNLAHKTWPEAYGSILSNQQLNYMLDLFYSANALQKQMEDGQHFFIALENELPIGFASWQLKSPFLARLQKLYVLPSFQGKNTGLALLNKVVNEAKLSGAGKLELNVNRFNPALSFYKKQGFVIDSIEDIDIGNGYFMNDYVMSRSL